jgi:hypothetical protein
MLDEGDVTSRLNRIVAELRDDSDMRRRLETNARALGEPNRRGAITDLIEEVAGVRS